MIGRAEVLLRGGVALWHLCQHPGNEQNSTSSVLRTECLQDASRVLDEGLASIDEKKALQNTSLEVAVAGAVARCEISLHSGNNDPLDLFSLLTHVGYGPWQVLRDSSIELPLSIYEPGLHVCIRGFAKIQRYDLAMQAMKDLVAKVSSNKEARHRLVRTSISVGKKLVEGVEERIEQDSTTSKRNGFRKTKLSSLGNCWTSQKLPQIN